MNPWAAIVGRSSDRRFEVTRSVVTALREAGLRVGGFVEETVIRDGRVIGWDAVDVAGGDRVPLARADADPELCDWRFDAGALEACRGWATAPALDVSVLEVGTLEARGRGHWATVREVFEGAPRLLLISVRPRALAAVGLSLPDPAAGIELPVDGGAIARFVEEVRSAAEERAVSA